MPLWMWNNVLDQLVLPKLQNDVELWDPLTDSVPLHSWLHPWLPFLGQQLEIVYPTIRYNIRVECCYKKNQHEQRSFSPQEQTCDGSYRMASIGQVCQTHSPAMEGGVSQG